MPSALTRTTPPPYVSSRPMTSGIWIEDSNGGCARIPLEHIPTLIQKLQRLLEEKRD